MSIAGYVTLGNFSYNCDTAKLRDKLQETLPSVTQPKHIYECKFDSSPLLLLLIFSLGFSQSPFDSFSQS